MRRGSRESVIALAAAVAVSVVICAPGALAAPSGAVRHAHINARIAGVFLMEGRVTVAVNVRGERRGEHLTRRWGFGDSRCSRSVCRRLLLLRERGAGIYDTVRLHRTGPGAFAGRSEFYAPLKCLGRRYRRGARVPYRITVRVVAATRIGSVQYATEIAATYRNRSRTDLTRCPLGPSHDAATYSGRLVPARAYPIASRNGG